jgi:hypothetical protein
VHNSGGSGTSGLNKKRRKAGDARAEHLCSSAASDELAHIHSEDKCFSMQVEASIVRSLFEEQMNGWRGFSDS